MTRTMDLNKMGLMHMDSLDLSNTNGGGVGWGDVVLWIVEKMVEHPQDTAAGVSAFVDGARSGSQTYGGIFFK